MVTDKRQLPMKAVHFRSELFFLHLEPGTVDISVFQSKVIMSVSDALLISSHQDSSLWDILIRVWSQSLGLGKVSLQHVSKEGWR
jgi:hypothetical protein